MSAIDVKKQIGPEQYEALLKRLKEVNKDIRARGIQSFRGWMDLLTGYAYNEFFDWDMYFENIYMSYYGVSKYCRNNAEVFLDTQMENGFITKQLNNLRPIQNFKPFLAQVALLGSRQTGSYTWLKDKYYTRIKKHLECWFWYSDFDKNGLCAWESADHAGMDNQDERAGKLHSFSVEGVDLNCYLYRDLQALSVIAGELGYTADQKDLDQKAQRLGGLINDFFWDEKDGFYYDRNERTGQKVRVKSIAGFLPLWIGVAPKERAKRLIEEHLLNPAEFWLPYPVATWSKTEPGYYQERVGIEANWRGPCWANTNYIVMHGLMNYGYTEAARHLAYRGMEMALAEADTREFYNSETGTGMGLNPFYGWSSLLYFMPLEFEMGYDPTNPHNNRILPLGCQEFGLTFPEK
jgi:hypothetical protein